MIILILKLVLHVVCFISEVISNLHKVTRQNEHKLSRRIKMFFFKSCEGSLV